MKKTLSILLSLILAVSVIPLFVHAAGNSCGSSLTWEYNKTTKTLTVSGTGEMTNYANCRLVPWKSIRAEAEHIELPEGLTSIGDYAFFKFTQIKEISIPSTVTYLGNGAFGACRGLTGVTLPDSVVNLGGWVFAGCTSLADIRLSGNLQIINYECFLNCPMLKEVTVPSSVTSIGGYAFGFGASHAFLYNTVLKGVPGSLTQSYADKNRIQFKSVYSGRTVNYRSNAYLAGTVPAGNNDGMALEDIDFNSDGVFNAKDSMIYKSNGKDI